MSANEELNLDGMQPSVRREITRFKITEGSHVYRVLPPFGTDHQRRASREIRLHWGFTKSDGNPSPLVCSYPTEGSCKICNHVKMLEGKAEREKTLGNTELADSISKDALSIRVRKTFLLNATNRNGEVGVLELTKTAHDQMIELMREYLNKYGKNPTSLKDGVWFVFTRSGKGFGTTYKVTLSKSIVTLEDGDQVEKIDRSPLAQNIVDNYDKLAYDIHAMYKPMSSDDLQRVLDGEPVDVVFKRDKVVVESTNQDVSPSAVTVPENKVANTSSNVDVMDIIMGNETSSKKAPETDDWMDMLS